MTDITKDDVIKISKLSQINIEENKIETVTSDLNGIIHWVKKLNEVDIENVTPLSGGIDMPLRLSKDEVNDGGYADKITKNAPLSDDNFFAVPKVVE